MSLGREQCLEQQRGAPRVPRAADNLVNLPALPGLTGVSERAELFQRRILWLDGLAPGEEQLATSRVPGQPRIPLASPTPRYQPLKRIRQNHAIIEVLLVDGRGFEHIQVPLLGLPALG